MKHNLSSGWILSADAGVSLPETLVALLILMMGTIGVMSMVPLSMGLTSTGRDYSLLTNRARDVAETLLASKWSDPMLEPGTHREEAEQRRFEASWNVRDFSIDSSSPLPPGREGIGGNLKVISITVITRGGTGVGRRDVTLVVMKGRD